MNMPVMRAFYHAVCRLSQLQDLSVARVCMARPAPVATFDALKPLPALTYLDIGVIFEPDEALEGAALEDVPLQDAALEDAALEQPDAAPEGAEVGREGARQLKSLSPSGRGPRRSQRRPGRAQRGSSRCGS